MNSRRHKMSTSDALPGARLLSNARVKIKASFVVGHFAFWQCQGDIIVFRVRSLVRIVVALVVLAEAGGALAQGNTRVRDVVYGRKFGMGLTMDVWKPPVQNGVGVIFVVSGAFKSGIEMVDSKFFGPALFKPFLDRGQTLFLVSHGAQPKFTVDEIVPDIHRAVRFIRVHAADHGVDPNRLAIVGASSGGFLSLTIGASGGPGDPSAEDPIDRASSRVQAVGCICPPCDLVNYGQSGRSIVEYEPVEFVWHAFGVRDKPREEQIEALRELSPINALTSDAPPTLIFHGDADPKVPHEQSVRFAARLKELDVPHELIIRKDAGHGWPEVAKDYARIADWFERHCKN
jgi:predicted esterase